MQIKKASMHIGRLQGKSSARHNDRTFDTSKNPSITHPERSQDNRFFIPTESGRLRPVKANRNSFEQAEKDFYEEHFSESLKRKNEAYVKKGHKEDTRIINQVRRGTKTAPTEIILQVGKDGDYQSVGNFEKMVKAFVEGLAQTYPNFKALNAAIHWDERSGHAHIRGVFISHTKDGLEEPCQAKALKEMGIQRPDPEKGNSKNNNEMVAFTENVREFWYQTIERIDPEITIDREVKTPSQKGITKLEHKYEMLKKRNENLEADASHIVQDLKRDVKKIFDENYLDVGTIKSFMEGLEDTMLYVVRDGIKAGLSGIDPTPMEINQIIRTRMERFLSDPVKKMDVHFKGINGKIEETFAHYGEVLSDRINNKKKQEREEREEQEQTVQEPVQNQIPEPDADLDFDDDFGR